jgi:hypothetical protein
MAGYKGHIAGSILFFLAGLALFSRICETSDYVLLLLCAIIGALFPDLDTSSKGRNIFKKLLPGIIFVLFVKNDINSLLLCILFFISTFFVRHRGIFHKTWFIVISGIFFTALVHLTLNTHLKKDFLIWIFFTLGALSHLLLDYAFQKKRI